MMQCLNVKLIVNIILNVFDGIHDNFSLALESPTSNALGNFKFPIDDGFLISYINYACIDMKIRKNLIQSKVITCLGSSTLLD